MDGFAYSLAGASPPLEDDISLPSYLEHSGSTSELSIEQLRKDHVYCFSVSADAPRERWSVYRCIYAEVDREDTTFLLNGGRWYRVATNYIQEVNEAIKKVPRSTVLNLPEYTDASEREYNQRVHASDPATFALVDRAPIHYGGGQSQIEFCDLYTTRKEFVHIKRYGGSAVLSHLFAQGTVSAAIFLNDARFRSEANKLLPSSRQIVLPDQRPQASHYEVAFGVASKVPGELVLPFFSRVTLRSTFQQLVGLGFRVTLTKIPVA